MAILNAVKAPTSTNPATAFMNVAVVDKEGNKHNLRTGIALYASNKLDAAIISKFASDENASLDIVVTSVRSNSSADADYDL
jgi:hypothetical protein